LRKVECALWISVLISCYQEFGFNNFVIPDTWMDTLKHLKGLKEEFEEKNRFCTGVHLPADIARSIRRELLQLYGQDPGEGLTTLFGIEVLSTSAPEIKFEG
jgi:hypothetical protein